MGLSEGGTGWEAMAQSTAGDKKARAQLGGGGWVSVACSHGSSSPDGSCLSDERT